MINFFHNAAVILGKSLSKMLHHLILNLEFDVKSIPQKIVKEDMGKLYSMIRSFEGNQYLKKK